MTPKPVPPTKDLSHFQSMYSTAHWTSAPGYLCQKMSQNTLLDFLLWLLACILSFRHPRPKLAGTCPQAPNVFQGWNV